MSISLDQWIADAKAEARAERGQDTKRLDWIIENGYRHNGQWRVEVGEVSCYSEAQTLREQIDARMAESKDKGPGMAPASTGYC